MAPMVIAPGGSDVARVVGHGASRSRSGRRSIEIVRYAGAGSATGLWHVRKLGGVSSTAMETEKRPAGVAKVEVETPAARLGAFEHDVVEAVETLLRRSATSAAWTGIG